MLIKPAILLLVVALASALLARARVRAVLARGLTTTAPGGATGREVARHILDEGGAAGVDIREYSGLLHDHYDPKNEVVFLSPENFQGSTATAHGTAAFHAGRALQHRHEPSSYHHRRAAVRTALAGAGLLALVALFLALLQRVPASFAVVLTAFGWAAAQLYNLVTVPIDFSAAKKPRASLGTLPGFPRRGKHAALTRKVLGTLALNDLAALLRTFPHLVYNTLPFLSRRGR